MLSLSVAQNENEDTTMLSLSVVQNENEDDDAFPKAEFTLDAFFLTLPI